MSPHCYSTVPCLEADVSPRASRWRARLRQWVVVVAACLLPATYAVSADETKAEAGIRYMHMVYQLCSATDPQFAADSAATYAAWLRQNREAIAKFADKPWYKKEVAAYLASERNNPHRQSICGILIEQLALSSKPPNPAFASPERTWSSFTTAMQKADRATLAICFAGLAESKWKPLLDKLSDAELASLGNATSEMFIEWGNDEMKSGWVRTKAGALGSVVFLNIYGNWKISEL